MTFTPEYNLKRNSHKGVCYTPQHLAEKSVEWMLEALAPFGSISNFVFYDPACGRGALLDALPAHVEKYGSTLEIEDVEYLQQTRDYGQNIFQLDFLGGDFSKIPPAIRKAQQAGWLVIFTNPPYYKLPAGDFVEQKEKYYTSDSVLLFYHRIFIEINPLAIFTWNKMDLITGGAQKQHRVFFKSYTLYKLRRPVMTTSKDWGLAGTFPIIFLALSEHLQHDAANKMLCLSDSNLQASGGGKEEDGEEIVPTYKEVDLYDGLDMNDTGHTLDVYSPTKKDEHLKVQNAFCIAFWDKDTENLRDTYPLTCPWADSSPYAAPPDPTAVWTDIFTRGDARLLVHSVFYGSNILQREYQKEGADVSEEMRAIDECLRMHWSRSLNYYLGIEDIENTLRGYGWKRCMERQHLKSEHWATPPHAAQSPKPALPTHPEPIPPNNIQQLALF